MAKLTLNLNIPLPLSANEDIHYLLEESGYTLIQQRAYYLQYQNPNQRVTFDFGGKVIYEFYYPVEDDRCAVWSTMATAHVELLMTDVNKVLLLHSLGVIDLTKIKSCRDMIQAAFQPIKNTLIISKEVSGSGH